MSVKKVKKKVVKKVIQKEEKTVKKKKAPNNPVRPTPKQEMFCQLWVDLVGNGTIAALKVFDIENKELLEIPEKDRTEVQADLINKAYNTASVMSSEYLRKPRVIKRIDELLDERGFCDETVKREHFKLILKADEGVKMRAISDFYKLKGKYQPDKTDLSVSPELISAVDKMNKLLPD